MNLQEIQQKLIDLNVNEYTEKKQKLTYLSWTHAWREVLKIYPDATYNIIKDEFGKCYFGDPEIGYMVHTTVTIEKVTREMYLPVMDGANKSMKLKPYTYSTKYSGDKTVDAISMFDINKTLMRCLTKNLAMFGLGLYIYAGEDLPEGEEKENKSEPAKKAPAKELKPATTKTVDWVKEKIEQEAYKDLNHLKNSMKKLAVFTDKQQKEIETAFEKQVMK
jgi:hypothetical protein